MTRRLSYSIISLMLPVIMSGQTYLSENFSNYIPRTFTTVNADGGVLKDNIYRNLGNDKSVAWTAAQLSNGYGRTAMSPTRLSGTERPTERWMILPPIKIEDPEAVLMWEARSLHKHLPETYKVAARTNGADEWTDLYICSGENHIFTLHSVPLNEFAGKDIELAFIATTDQGFILAVDNIFVGVPTDPKYAYTSRTPHYVGKDDDVSITGSFECFWNSQDAASLKLIGINDPATIDIPSVKCGERVDVDFSVSLQADSVYHYTISLVTAQGETPIYSDFISCSSYSRHHIIDRGSGTWCNSCPMMELTTSRLEQLYGQQLTIVEAHVNDMLVNEEYWHDYLADRIFGIPALIPNHNLGSLTNSIASTDNFASALGYDTKAMISATAAMLDNGDVHVSSQATFAYDIDNLRGNFRIAYMLVGDIHDPLNGYYLQALSASSFRQEQFYYMSDPLMPELMYFDNVPLNAQVAVNGVPASLPATISAQTPYCHEFSLSVPDSPAASDLKVIAMIIDTDTSAVLNAVETPVISQSAITSAISDTDAEAQYFDLYGRRVASTAQGIVIKRQGDKAFKILNLQ